MRPVLILSAAIALSAVLIGCNTRDPDPPSDRARAGDKKGLSHPHKEGKHAHAPGAHGGVVVEIGRDNYHGEVLVEAKGLLVLYTLGKDETKIQVVEPQKVTFQVQTAKDAEPVEVVLEPSPQSNDTPGKTSRFAAPLPESLWGKDLILTSPSGMKIAGDRFRINSFTLSRHKTLPPAPGAGTQKERDLFLKPGGIYTEADIKRNGGIVPSVKFKDMEWPHDDKIKVGDRLCPITDNKADPRCAWVVGGKEYQFCCPPCLTRFVTLAKTDSKKIKAPEEYVKK